MLISLISAEIDATTHLAQTLEAAQSAELALRHSSGLAKLYYKTTSTITAFDPLLVPRHHLQPYARDQPYAGDRGESGEDDNGEKQQSDLLLTQQAARLAKRKLERAGSSSRRLWKALSDLDVTECHTGLLRRKASLEKEKAQAERVLEMFGLIADRAQV